MRFETKILITFFSLYVISVSLFNLFIAYNLVNQYEKEVAEKAKRIVDRSIQGYTVEVPPYLRIEREDDRLRINKDFAPLTFYKGSLIFIKKNYIYSKVINFLRSLFLAETAVMIFITGVFYLFISRAYRREQEYRNILTITLLAFSHRMGNFLASLKLALETSINPQKTVQKIDRIKRLTTLLEEDFAKNSRLLNSLFKGYGIEKENVDILSQIREIVFDLKKRHRHKILRLTYDKTRSFSIKTNPFLLKMLLQILLENSFKYSENKIRIKLSGSRKKICLFISNDVVPERIHGSGIGLEIARYIVKSLKIGLKTKATKTRYMVLLELS